MRRAVGLLAAAAVMAGCGGHDTTASTPTPAPTAVVAPPTPTVAEVTPAPTATTASGRPKATRTPRLHATAAPTPVPGLANPGSAISGVARYLKALNDHDIPAICAHLASPTPPVCGGPGAHLPVQPQLNAPPLARISVSQRPQIRRSGRTALATVEVVALDGSGRAARSTETLQLRRADGQWNVEKPTPIFYRAIDRQSP